MSLELKNWIRYLGEVRTLMHNKCKCTAWMSIWLLLRSRPVKIPFLLLFVQLYWSWSEVASAEIFRLAHCFWSCSLPVTSPNHSNSAMERAPSTQVIEAWTFWQWLVSFPSCCSICESLDSAVCYTRMIIGLFYSLLGKLQYRLWAGAQRYLVFPLPPPVPGAI